MSQKMDLRPRVLLTRSSYGNRSTSKMLLMHGYVPIQLNTIRFKPPRDWSNVDRCLLDLHQFDWIILTSSVGVKFFLKRMRVLGLGFPWGGKPSIATVGKGTAMALKKNGFEVDFMPTEYLTEKLAEELPVSIGKNVLLLRSNIARNTLGEILKKRGFKVKEETLYLTEPISQIRELHEDKIDVITFASPSAVDSFCRAVPRDRFDQLLRKRVVCIGPVTADTARRWGFTKVEYPQLHTFEGLIECIKEGRRE